MRRSSGFVARWSNSSNDLRSCSNTATIRVGRGRSDAYHTFVGHPDTIPIPQGFCMSAPIVALTATTKIIDGMVRLRLNEAYVQAVRAAGLTPLVLPPLPPEELEPVLAAVRGVVLTGGEDVDPAEYGAASLGSTPPHTERDKCELALVRLARDRNIPTLAICRGIQVVNVALGG